MDTTEQIAAREAKVRLVGDVLDRAGCAHLYEAITVEQAERLYQAILDTFMDASAAPSAPAVVRGWCQTMRTDRSPASGRYAEGWNNALGAMAMRIEREFDLERI